MSAALPDSGLAVSGNFGAVQPRPERRACVGRRVRAVEGEEAPAAQGGTGGLQSMQAGGPGGGGAHGAMRDSVFPQAAAAAGAEWRGPRQREREQYGLRRSGLAAKERGAAGMTAPSGGSMHENVIRTSEPRRIGKHGWRLVQYRATQQRFGSHCVRGAHGFNADRKRSESGVLQTPARVRRLFSAVPSWITP